jgi:predicted permease
VLLIYLIGIAFLDDIYVGIRGLSGALFPLVLITFTYFLRRNILEQLARPHPFIIFVVSMAIGVAVMIVIKSFVYNPAIPVTEMVLSSSFSILIFSYVSLKENEMLPYFYGMISGFLFYIVFWGFPVLK